MTSVEPLRPGSLIDGRYRVDEQIGEGGFGRVFRGMHLVLEAPIAIKTLRLDVGGDEAERSLRFLDEARLLSKLRHPHIVRVIDAGIHSSTPPQGWLVVEWCEGLTLADDLAENAAAARSVREVWELLGPLVDAVATAHEANIVHRDIKPSNVMISRGPKGAEARLIDFGIAKAILLGEESPSESKTRGRVAFTTAYAAPEQLAASRTGTWTDVHALGLLLTEVLTGSPPYPRGEELHAILDQVHRPTPKRFGVNVGDWEGVLGRAVAFKSSERYQSARELHDALERSLPELAFDRTSAVSDRQLALVRSRPGSRSGETERDTSASMSKPRERKHDPSTITAAVSSRDAATAPSMRTPPREVPRALFAIPIALAVGVGAWAILKDAAGPTEAGSPAASGSSVSSGLTTAESVADQGTTVAPQVVVPGAPTSSASTSASATSSATTTPAPTPRPIAPTAATARPTATSAASTTATATAAPATATTPPTRPTLQ